MPNIDLALIISNQGADREKIVASALKCGLSPIYCSNLEEARTLLLWPFAPMHQRAVLATGGGTLTDSMHIGFGIVTVLIILVAIGFGAAAFGKRFHIYSIATLVILVVFGTLTGLDGARAADLPTPRVGVWERISIGVFLLWLVVLAIRLLRVRELQLRMTLVGRSDSRIVGLIAALPSASLAGRPGLGSTTCRKTLKHR